MERERYASELLLNKTRRLQIMLSLSFESQSAKKKRRFCASLGERTGSVKCGIPRGGNLATSRKNPVRHPFLYANCTTAAAALLNFIHMRWRRRRCMFLSRRFFLCDSETLKLAESPKLFKESFQLSQMAVTAPDFFLISVRK